MNRRRRPVSRARSSNRRQKEAVPVKAVVFILVIGFSLAMRFASTGPLYKARERISQVLLHNSDFGEAIETLGRSFTGGDGESGDNAVLVFGRMILGLDDEESGGQEVQNNTEDEPEPTSSSPDVSSISDTMAGDISGLAYDIAESPFPKSDPSNLDCGFEEAADIDGTPNEAFHIPSPDSVDDTAYRMDFKTVMPLSSYRVTSKYGYRIHPISGNTTFHYGVDLAAPAGTEIYAIADGTVSETGCGSINGNYIKLSHDDGFATHYAHLKTIKVSKGQKVKAGDVIGLVGSTGYSTGPHLHFEVRKNGLVVNPFDNFSF